MTARVITINKSSQCPGFVDGTRRYHRAMNSAGDNNGCCMLDDSVRLWLEIQSHSRGDPTLVIQYRKTPIQPVESS